MQLKLLDLLVQGPFQMQQQLIQKYAISFGAGNLLCMEGSIMSCCLEFMLGSFKLLNGSVNCASY